MNFIADAKKKGFTIPLASWINDIMLNDIKDLFGDEFKNSFTFINYDYFQKVIEEHTNKKNNYKKIWSLFVLLRWLKNNRISC